MALVPSSKVFFSGIFLSSDFLRTRMAAQKLPYCLRSSRGLFLVCLSICLLIPSHFCSIVNLLDLASLLIIFCMMLWFYSGQYMWKSLKCSKKVSAADLIFFSSEVCVSFLSFAAFLTFWFFFNGLNQVALVLVSHWIWFLPNTGALNIWATCDWLSQVIITPWSFTCLDASEEGLWVVLFSNILLLPSLEELSIDSRLSGCKCDGLATFLARCLDLVYELCSFQFDSLVLSMSLALWVCLPFARSFHFSTHSRVWNCRMSVESRIDHSTCCCYFLLSFSHSSGFWI